MLVVLEYFLQEVLKINTDLKQNYDWTLNRCVVKSLLDLFLQLLSAAPKWPKNQLNELSAAALSLNSQYYILCLFQNFFFLNLNGKKVSRSRKDS